MTDLEKLESVFKEIGVKYEKEEIDEIRVVSYDGEAEYNTTLIINNGVGYYYFNCQFYFLEGKFQNHGVWE